MSWTLRRCLTSILARFYNESDWSVFSLFIRKLRLSEIRTFSEYITYLWRSLELRTGVWWSDRCSFALLMTPWYLFCLLDWTLPKISSCVLGPQSGRAFRLLKVSGLLGNHKIISGKLVESDLHALKLAQNFFPCIKSQWNVSLQARQEELKVNLSS